MDGPTLTIFVCGVKNRPMNKWHRLKACRRKIRHPFFDVASKELFRMKQRLNKIDFLRIYHCRECRGWHIGNSVSLQNAKKSLRALEQKMARDEFRKKAPLRIQ